VIVVLQLHPQPPTTTVPPTTIQPTVTMELHLQ